MTRPLKFWGWGREGDGLIPSDVERLERFYAERLGFEKFAAAPVPRADDIVLRAPRLPVPGALAGCCTTDHYERLLHSYGKSFFDSVRVFARDFANPPDVVALPRNEQEVADVLDWCTRVRARVVPYGGGSSVVGGVNPPEGDTPVVTLDLRHLGRVLEIDPESQAARIEAGILGPALETGLKPSGLTLRHFPQSFEYSTLGGWIATRGGGHFVSLYTHIDEMVESVRALTPKGVYESRRLPGSGAGPSPDRLMIGSEGILGVIVSAWMRLRPRPTFRAATSVRFAEFHDAASAVRGIAQAHLYPANCRLIDSGEAANTGAGDGRHALLVLGFESADHPVEAALSRALELCRDHHGEPDAAGGDEHRGGASGQWREAFIRAPYAREVLTPRGIIVETFETSITWERFPAFHAAIVDATRRAIREVTGRDGMVTCRFTHIYPDGPAPYFTFHAVGDPNRMIDQCWAIKRAASDAIIAHGGTITHHHAVGRDHRPWYDRQVPALFSAALRAAKQALDPAGILNPGVLVDPA